MSPARAQTRTARSRVERTNHEATMPPTKSILSIYSTCHLCFTTCTLVYKCSLNIASTQCLLVLMELTFETFSLCINSCHGNKHYFLSVILNIFKHANCVQCYQVKKSISSDAQSTLHQRTSSRVSQLGSDDGLSVD